MPFTVARLNSKFVRTALTVGLVVATATYCWFVLRGYLASRYAGSADQASLRRAIALEPGNAAYYNALGRYLLFGKQDPIMAVTSLKRATELNPYDSNYWLNLALAYYDAGDESQQELAVQRAIEVNPTTPDVAWNAANFFLVQGNTTEALRQFQVVLRGDPAMAMPALELCWRVVHNVEAIEAILPANPDVYLQFINLLSAKDQSTAANQIWSALLQLGVEFDSRRALFYVDNLLEKGDVGRASSVWNQLVSRSSALGEYQRGDNLVVDGKFAQAILNVGFDWRYVPRPDISVLLDTTQFHTGGRSLKISYANNGDDAGVFQYVPVEPGKRYVISAWVKSEELQTANGPFISVSDTYNRNVYATTEETVGTTVWHRVQDVFQTGPASKLVTVAFTRKPGNTLIHGHYWVEEISLQPVGALKKLIQ